MAIKEAVMAVPGIIVYTGIVCLVLMVLLMFKQIAIDPAPPFNNAATNAGTAGYMPTQEPKPTVSPTPTKKPVTNLPTEPQTHVVTAAGALAEDKPQVSTNPTPEPTPSLINHSTGQPPKVGDIGWNGNGQPDPGVQVTP